MSSSTLSRPESEGKAPRRSRPAKERGRPGTQKSIAMTVLMGAFLIYTVLPLVWLVINAPRPRSSCSTPSGSGSPTVSPCSPTSATR